MQLRGRKPDFIGFKGVGGEGLNRTSTDNLQDFAVKRRRNEALSGWRSGVSKILSK